jgi:hypothetical protein
MLNKVHRLTVFWAAFILAPLLYSQSENQSGVLLCGHNFADKDALRKSTDVVVASFVTLVDAPIIAWAGETSHNDKVHIIKTLQGALSGDMNLNYDIADIDMPERNIRSESTPKLGVNYILFVQNTKSVPQMKDLPANYQIVKMFEINDANLARVNQLLSGTQSVK